MRSRVTVIFTIENLNFVTIFLAVYKVYLSWTQITLLFILAVDCFMQWALAHWWPLWGHRGGHRENMFIYPNGRYISYLSTVTFQYATAAPHHQQHLGTWWSVDDNFSVHDRSQPHPCWRIFFNKWRPSSTTIPGPTFLLSTALSIA